MNEIVTATQENLPVKKTISSDIDIIEFSVEFLGGGWDEWFENRAGIIPKVLGGIVSGIGVVSWPVLMLTTLDDSLVLWSLPLVFGGAIIALIGEMKNSYSTNSRALTSDEMYQFGESLKRIRGRNPENNNLLDRIDVLNSFVHARQYGINFVTSAEALINSPHGVKVSDEVLESEEIIERALKVDYPDKIAVAQAIEDGVDESKFKWDSFKKILPSSKNNVPARIMNIGESMVDASRFVNILERIESELDAYEMNILEILKYPLINDLSDEDTAKFRKDLAYTRAFIPEGDFVDYANPFIRSVTDVEAGWEFLKQKARVQKLSGFGEEERKRVESAQKLLAIALDVTSSHHERQTSYRKAIKDLEGIIAIPDSAREALQSGVLRLELIAPVDE